MKYFTADTHINHNNIRRYCGRPWNSVQEMNEALIRKWNSVVKENDEIYHLGDLGFGSLRNTIGVLERLNGKKYLIKGNHDYHCKKADFQRHFEWIRDYYLLRVQDPEAERGRQKIVLSHFAFYVWDGSHRGTWNLFGHSHGSLDEWSRDRLSIDVGVDSEHTNYYPISYEKVKEIMSGKEIKLVDHHDENTDS